MRGVEGKEGKRRFGFSYILLAVAIVTYLCTWGYSVLAADWRAKADVPQIENQAEFRASLRAFLTARNPIERTLEVIDRGGHHDPVLWKEMARLGLQGIAIPERYGGAGAGGPELAVIFEGVNLRRSSL